LIQIAKLGADFSGRIPVSGSSGRELDRFLALAKRHGAVIA
jgi:hypothetical protein